MNTNYQSVKRAESASLPRDSFKDPTKNSPSLSAELTTPDSNATFFAKVKELGLSSDQVVQYMHMIEKEEIPKKYDFTNLKPDTKGIYRIWVKDATASKGKQRLYAKNLDNLKEKVYEHEKTGSAHKKATDSDGPKITFDDAFKYAMKFERTNTSPERQASHNNTIDKDESEYKRFFGKTDFKNKLISEITVFDLDTIIREIILSHRLTEGGKNALRTIINKTFKQAYFMSWIRENTAERLIWKDYKHLLKMSAPLPFRAFSEAELEMLLAATRERQQKDPSYIPAYAYEFQLLTAMRRGEICPLKTQAIDSEAKTLWIHQELIPDRGNKRNLVITDYTKTHKDRFYPLADLEELFLEKMMIVLKTYYPDSMYLFPGNTTVGCIGIEAVYAFHYKLCKKLGLDVSKDFKKGPHSFRRNRITETVNNTDGNTVLAAQMHGNSPETIRKNYYTNDSLERQRDALNRRKVI